ncbi:MAG: PAS domain-containing sensor histidine kinase [Promethearchaeia archaeon]
MNDAEELKKKRQEVEKEYRSFLENFEGIAFKGYKDSSVDFLTGNVEEITGYTEEDFLSREISFPQLIVPEDRNRVQEDINKFMSSSRKTDKREFRIRDKYGDIHHIRERVSKKYEKEQQKKYVYGTIQDITQYTEVKRELETHKKYLQRLVDEKTKDLKIKNQALDASLNAIAITDMEGDITYVNSAFLSLWGYQNKEEVIGKSGIEFWGNKEKTISVFRKTLKEGKYKGDFLALKKDGTKMSVDLKTSLILDDEGKKMGIVGSFNDITKHIKMQQKLKKEKNHSEFYKDLLAHDMGNILNNIKSSLDLMELYKNKSKNGKKTEEFMEILQKQVKRGINLIRNVRKLSEIEQQGQKIQDINVVEILQEVIENIPRQFHGKNVEIQTNIPDKDLMVKGGTLLIEAFENILNNGIVHNDKEKIKLWVEVSEVQRNQEKFVKMEFKDNGRGINDQRKEYIFQKNYKQAKRKGGMGIGLSLVRRIVEGSGGEIAIENRVNDTIQKGSNFILLLKKSN